MPTPPSSTSTFETKRLVARPWAMTDAPRLHEVLADPDVVRWFGTPRVVNDLAEVEQRIEGYAGIEPPRGVWALTELKGDGGQDRVVGSVMLIELPGTDLTQAGWWLHPDSTGRGYATEGCAALLAHGLAVGLTEIRAVIDVDNAPSIAVAERIGMRRLGVVDEDTRPAEMFTYP